MRKAQGGTGILPVSRTGLQCLTLSGMLLATSFSAGADYSVLVSPQSADVSILDGTSEYLAFVYYDWGPGWSGVTRKKTVVEKGGAAYFTFSNVLQKTTTPFILEGSWKASGAKGIRFDATLTAGGDSDLVMAQFGLNTGAAFEGGQAIVTQDDGSTANHTLPLGRGTLGDRVVKLELIDAQGEKTLLTFEHPMAIPMDGQARLAIAKDAIKSGVVQKLAFTLELPRATEFIPGPDAAGALVDMSDWYAFDPPSPIPADSEWQMGSWLETPAGKHGRITRKGDKLVYHGKPIKLWGLNTCYSSCAPEKDLADKRADFYAAMGVNAVRLHKYADGTGWAGILTKESAVEFEPEALDRMDYFVAALKKRGIYTKLSPVFIIDIGPGDRERVPYMDELGPMKGHRINPKHGSLYISTELQDLLIEQVIKLLKHANPYTGLTYADDPSIAYVELYNEDSALFGGVTSVMAKSATLRARTGAMFSEWLKKKYSSEEAFLEAWGANSLNCSILSNQQLPLDESWSEHRIYPAGNPWFFDPSNLDTSQRAFRRRLLDTMGFLYELQNRVYTRYIKAIRKAGYRGEIIASNWQSGRMMSHFYNLHSDSMAGTVDRHNYFGGGAGGGGIIRSASMLSQPGSGSLSSSLQLVAGRPFMLSEWIHVFPNEWGVEGPAILGAYGMGLQGWDVSYAFQNRDAGSFSPAVGLDAWDVTSPQFIGIFPAVSRQVHRGDVKESRIVHYRNVHVPSLAQGKVGFDERVKQEWDVKSFTSDVFPAEALAVARGEVRFTRQFEPTESFDLGPYRKDGQLLSSTHQLRWTPGKSAQDGHIVINTPGTQAVIGFAEGRTTRLADARITPRSRFAAIYLSAQSRNKKLANDPGVLVTAISRARNEGMVVVKDSYLMSKGEIQNHRPTGPVVMEPVVAEIELTRRGSPTVHVLDHGGAKTGRTVPVRNGRFTIDTGRDESPYYLVEY